MSGGLRRATAASTLVVVAVTVLGACSNAAPRATVVPEAAVVTSTTTTTVPTTVAPTTEPPTTEAPTTTAPPVNGLTTGASGDEVAALQARLQELGYWVPEVSGAYDSITAHAVTAFQKRSELPRDGVAGPETIAALTTATRPTAQSTQGHVIEVDLGTQTLLVVDDGVVNLVLDASTGKVAGTTPRGEWSVYRQVNGNDRGPLGVLYRPKYFVGGVAVHGYSSVPAFPASHGCVRVPNAAMDMLWASDALPVGTPVWVY